MYCLIQNQTLILDEPTNDLDCHFKCIEIFLLDYPVPTWLYTWPLLLVDCRSLIYFRGQGVSGELSRKLFWFKAYETVPMLQKEENKAEKKRLEHNELETWPLMSKRISKFRTWN
jgi:hypothetical protein